MESLEFKPVPTRASLALQNKNKCSEFKALIFEEPKSSFTSTKHLSNEQHPEKKRENFEGNKKQHLNVENKKNNLGKNEVEFDIKKARHEVLNFAMNNQRVIKNQKKMQIFQAVKLGAKAPKKAYKNYKELKDERKRLKDIREQRKKFNQLGKNQTGAASVKCNSKTKSEKLKKKRAPVSRIDQNYGVVRPKLKK